MSSYNTNWNNVLRILAITVIIDGRVREAELAAFIEHAKGMASLCDQEDISSTWLQNWYDKNKLTIIDQMQGRGKNTTILKAFATVKEPAIREALFDSIIHIAVSDKEYHEAENDLVRSAAAIWGFVRPPIKVVRPT